MVFRVTSTECHDLPKSSILKILSIYHQYINHHQYTKEGPIVIAMKDSPGKVHKVWMDWIFNLAVSQQHVQKRSGTFTYCSGCIECTYCSVYIGMLMMMQCNVTYRCTC